MVVTPYCPQTHAGQTPDDDTDYWEIFARGFVSKAIMVDSTSQEYRPVMLYVQTVTHILVLQLQLVTNLMLVIGKD